MYILVVDDEPILRADQVKEVQKVFPTAHILDCDGGAEALQTVSDFVKQGRCFDYAFLDISMPDMDGIQLAIQMKQQMPDVILVFCTGYEQYACQAYQIYSKGYIMKPVTQRKIEKDLDEMVVNWRNGLDATKKRVRIQTFGHFEVFVEDKPLAFQRAKAKELLAYLVDRRGASVTNGDIASIIWEDRPCDSVVMNQVRVIKTSLIKTLREAGVSDIILKSWNHIALDVTKVKCDRYDMEHGDSVAINTYRGEYLANYSWAEETNAGLYLKSYR